MLLNLISCHGGNKTKSEGGELEQERSSISYFCRICSKHKYKSIKEQNKTKVGNWSKKTNTKRAKGVENWIKREKEQGKILKDGELKQERKRENLKKRMGK